MGTKSIKNPKGQRPAEKQFDLSQENFGGMVKDMPLTEIPLQNVYRHVDMIGHGPWSEGRPGSRRYSKAGLPSREFTADPVTDRLTLENRYLTGDRVKVSTTGTLPAPLVPNTYYYITYLSDTLVEIASTLANAIAGIQINITAAGTGTHTIRSAANLRAVLDHKTQKKIIKQYGREVFVAEKILESYEKVICIDSATPSDNVARLAAEGDNAVLAATDIFRIALDEDDDVNYMYRINSGIPVVILTDVNEDVTNIYGYRYYYSLARIIGDGIRNRVTEGAILKWESGTCKDPAQEKQFGEVYFPTPIGADLTEDHINEYLTCPIGIQAATHFPLYRTKNIGSGTALDINDKLKAYYVFADDVPVAKAISVTVAGNVATIAAGQNPFVIGDVGCTLRSDLAGARAGVIESYVDPNNVNLAIGHTLNAVDDVCIGEGRQMTVTQANRIVTRTAGDVYLIGDEGKTIFFGDGTSDVVVRWIDANNVEMAHSNTKASMSSTIQRVAGTYAWRRKWNDTVLDDGVAVGEIGLNERILSQRDLYIPQFNFERLPDANIVIIDSGFMVTAMRDEVGYYYSHIGAKGYIAGMYRIDQQFGELPVSIRDIIVMPAMAIFLSPNNTYNMSLNVPIANVGNPDVGEFIQKLIEPSEVDGKIGVTAWQTVRYVNASLFIAMTSEPGIRLFSGQAWSQRNYALIENGDPAVMDDLLKIDPFYGIIAWYSYKGGYKISAAQWRQA